MKRIVNTVVLALVVALLSPGLAPAAMEDYCVVPPYVIQNLPPNVMLLLDNSESMYRFAYEDLSVPTSAYGWTYIGYGCLNPTLYPRDDFRLQNPADVSYFSVGDYVYIQKKAMLALDAFGCWTTAYPTSPLYTGPKWRGLAGDRLQIRSIVGSLILLQDPDTGLPAQLYSDYSYMFKAEDIVIYDSTDFAGYYPVDQSFDPNKTYYGYFDPGYWYKYQAQTFQVTNSKASASRDAATEWDGNFLNWLTTRRIDALRKALTGGNATAAGHLVSQRVDALLHGAYKRADNAQDYIPSAYAPASGNRCFYLAPGTGTATLQVSDATDGANCTGTLSAAINLNKIEVPTGTEIEGVLQTVVGAKARIGLTYFDTSDEGGQVEVDSDGQALSSVINMINNPSTPLGTKTPLGEALWTVVGYHASSVGYRDAQGKFSTNTIYMVNGPSYDMSDYGVIPNTDPMNFGTAGSPRRPPCARSYVILITDGGPCRDGNLPPSIKDYAETAGSPFNCGSPGSAEYCPGITNTVSGESYSFDSESLFDATWEEWETECTSGDGHYAGLEDVALYMHTTDIRDATVDTDPIEDDQNIDLFVVSAFTNSTLLKYAAINGGFEDNDGDGLPSAQSEWDNLSESGHEPDNYYGAEDAASLPENLANAFKSILKRASSGTAASVLASGEGSGANLVQAVFYPRRRFGNEVILWTGTLQNFWYYVDPFFTYSDIREDTPSAGIQDYVLDLQQDKVAALFFDDELEATHANMYEDTDGDGAYDMAATPDVVAIEEVNFLWEAGKELFDRDPDTRTIYTNINGTGFEAFVNASASTLAPYLGVTDDNASGSNLDEAETTINYMLGYDTPTTRNRSVSISNTTGVWKLGDILDSTPKIVSHLPINSYYSDYYDFTYGTIDPHEGKRGFVNSTTYQSRGAVFAGGNDGMLHAFKLGTLVDEWVGQSSTQVAKMTDTTDIGKELWGFIPRHVLPYLKYIQETDYCHIYSVDLSPYIFDASFKKDADPSVTHPTGCSDANYWNCVKTESSWRTVVIGGLRFGGACKAFGAAGVSAPVQVGGVDIGYSSYFAIDVTNPESPEFMWEFSDPALGFSTSGPSVVKINGYEDTNGNGSIDVGDAQQDTANGRWLVVLGSGPTGPIDTVEHQFMGESDQALKFFVLDLVSGQQITGSPKDVSATLGIGDAFAGSMINVTEDDNLDYSDDALYVGYVEEDTSVTPTSTWTKGGVVRILTNGDFNNITNWSFSKVIDGIGPVTSSVQALRYEDNTENEHALWLYFGTGRYYYAVQSGQDDIDGQQHLYGLKDPCYMNSSTLFDMSAATCTDPIVLGDATSAGVDTAATSGWYIALDPAPADPVNCSDDEASADYDSNCGYGAERVITDPMSSTTGVIYFTSYKPYDEECGLGGKSYLWAVEYDTGGDPMALLKGSALLQVSTGSIEKVNLSDQFTERGGRRSGSIEGVPPTAQGLSLFLTPGPEERVIHIQEK
jgi:type IV pilus assembly protein PilY1